MACKPVCKLCDRLVISQAVTFTGGNLVIKHHDHQRAGVRYHRHRHPALPADGPLLRTAYRLRHPHADAVFRRGVHQRHQRNVQAAGQRLPVPYQ